MKRIWIYLLALVLALGIPLTAAAQEIGLCTLSAGSAAAVPGDSVTIPVEITGNPGFTNFALLVKYDPAALRLERIDTVGETGDPFLCPETVSVNPAYSQAEGDSPCGYITAASAEPVQGDGVLIMLTFRVLQEIPGETEVELELSYLRCGDALTSAFASLTASAEAGKVLIVLKGDVDGDGSITEADASFLYRYINEALTLTAEQLAAADVSGDGMVDTTDAAILYRILHGTMDGFPEVISEEVTE